jgi:hypothetical protein
MKNKKRIIMTSNGDSIMTDKNKKTVEGISKLLPDLYEYTKEKLGVVDDISGICFIVESDIDDAMDFTLGRTGQYNPDTKKISLYIKDRHPKDILKSFVHEMIHFGQDLDGHFSADNIGYTGQGYAQKNSHLREMETDAYLRSGIIFRDWEDGIKADKPQLYEFLKVKSGGNKKLLKEQVYSQSQALMNGNTMDELDGQRTTLIGFGVIDDQGAMDFDDLFMSNFDDLLSDYNFSLNSKHTGYAYDYANNNSNISIFPFGQSGLMSPSNKTGSSEDSKVYMNLEIANPENKEIDIYGKNFNSMKELKQYLEKVLEGE